MTPRKAQDVAGELRLIGYVRVSTAEQADSGAGLTAQRQAINTAAAQRGWSLVRIVDDAGLSAKTLERPGMVEVLDAIRVGEADGLVVSKLDRLSRSLLDFAKLMKQSREEGWTIVALDLGVDTSTPAGEMMANVLATFSQFERDVISQRTRNALAVKKAEGVVLGRPRLLQERTVARIVELREAGLSFGAIANRLNEEGVATAQGGKKWYPATVRKVLAYATSG